MSKLNKVWLFAAKKESLAELYTAARQLGENVAVIFAGPRAEARGEQVYYLGETGREKLLEDHFPSVIRLVTREKPDLTLIEATVKGRLLAGALTAALGTSALVNSGEITIENDEIQAVRMVYGGAAFRTEKVRPPAIALVGAGAYEAGDPPAPAAIHDVSDSDAAETRNIKCLEIKRLIKEQVNLAAAKIVVGAGRGFSKREYLALAAELAETVGGEVACSRPIAEGEGWMPKERYIGVSGLMLKPEVYFALGISGQIQHMVGVNQARTIFAINKDKNAPVFKLADYGLVADLTEALPKLTAKLKK